MLTLDALVERFRRVRERSVMLCKPLQPEDYVVQPVVDVSPPKWHLGHTTWFWEAFVLKHHKSRYQEFHPEYNYVFNSYYESIGARVLRTDRGNLSRPTVQDVYNYRAFVDEAMMQWLCNGMESPHTRNAQELMALVELGLNHEEQHQELLATDIKYILGHNPLFPAYDDILPSLKQATEPFAWISIPEGVYEIGYTGDGFCFDNELGIHKVFLHQYRVANRLVTNAEYLEFMLDGGYTNFRHWLGEGFQWVRDNNVQAPLYWLNFGTAAKPDWKHYTARGLEAIPPNEPVKHISFYEADAYAAWRGAWLLTEFEWEIAAPRIAHGELWEWTNSAYLPYPGFTRAEGAIGEYNGKFMINQMVLRGGSIATPPNHARPTYRNFFHPPLRWQFTGIRLAQKH